MRVHRVLAIAVIGLSGLSAKTWAADGVKGDSGSDLSVNSSWLGGIAPDASGLAIFNATDGDSLNLTLGADLVWNGVRVLNPGGGVTLGAGSNVLTLGSGGIDMSGAVQSLAIGSSLSLGAPQTWNIGAAESLNISGNLSLGAILLTIAGPGNTAISGPIAGIGSGGALTKQGSGTATLSAANSYAGITTINNGVLLLNFGATPSNILNSAGTVALTGGTFRIAGTNATQTLANLRPTTGTSHISVGNGNTLTLTTVTPKSQSSAGAVLIDATGTVMWGVGAQALITDSGANPYVTYGLNDWAATDATGRVIAANYVAAMTSLTAGANNDMQASFTLPNLPADVNSLRFNSAAPQVLGITGTNIFTARGILVSSISGGGTITGSSATIRASKGLGSSNSFNIVQNSLLGDFKIDTVIATAGGNPQSVVKSGPGRLILSQVNTFSGGLFINEGIVQGSSSANFGGGAIVFNGGTLEANGTFNNTHPLTINDGGATISVPGANAMTASDLISGPGALAKSGPGTLVLSAAAGNLFSGGVNVTGGALLASDTSGSATGTGAVVVGSGAAISGTGFIGGAALVNSGGKIIPGSSGIGTLTVNNLTLAAGSALDFEFGAVSYDSIAMQNSNTLNLAGAVTLHLFNVGATTAFASNGVYNIITGIGTLLGTPGNLVVGNPVGGASYLLSQSGSNIVLTIAGAAASNTWNVTGGTASWGGAGNWSNHVPNVSGDTAEFTGALAGGTGTVTLDGSRIVGGILLNNTAGSYVISQGSGGALILDNGSSAAVIHVAGGSHVIAAPLTLNSSTSITLGGSLTISGIISGTASSALTINGAGMLVLSGNNNFAGGISIGAGAVVQLDPGGAFGGGALSNAGLILLNRDDAYAIQNVITGTGALTKSGAGTATLTGIGNAWSGPLTVSSGKLIIGANGAWPTNVALNLTGGSVALASGINTIQLSSLTIAGTPGAPGATLDLKDGGMVLGYSDGAGAALAMTTYKQVIAARGVPDGDGISDYSGKGITSSTAAMNNQAARFDKFGVGLINNADLNSIGVNAAYTTFLGATGIPPNSVLARYTYMGDINLDGKIDIDDYNYIDAGFEGALPGFLGQIIGDFNGDGIVNIDDYNIIDTGFGFQSGPLNPGALSNLDELTTQLSAVPEPAGVWWLALGATLPLLWRGRRNRARIS